MTSYHAYMFHINTNGSNNKKDIIEKLIKHGEFMTFENEKLNEMKHILKIRYYIRLPDQAKNMQLMHS